MPLPCRSWAGRGWGQWHPSAGCPGTTQLAGHGWGKGCGGKEASHYPMPPLPTNQATICPAFPGYVLFFVSLCSFQVGFLNTSKKSGISCPSPFSAWPSLDRITVTEYLVRHMHNREPSSRFCFALLVVRAGEGNLRQQGVQRVGSAGH